ncbi:hypothetical protein BE04_46175 [Sorangium cellulosum]|uniref:Uncharacterized protein n=2 Tax=Sorangium cellulosum TaxID=56 RepID=A0A150P8F5_SORCE|nr:hypothetical protein [Sorangium cellulosum]AGP34001.1 hypothetical protein SCE1572_05515 [Sorangium cellulosum So0157-2]KYF51957.1 hypothetical protein BE04_46175 [Sorangium cellulosum]
MKRLSQEEIRDLAKAVLATKPDELTCDEWLDYAAQYAELVAEGAPVPEALREAAQHLDQCPECAEELRACLLALAAR